MLGAENCIRTDGIKNLRSIGMAIMVIGGRWSLGSKFFWILAMKSQIM
jgi:hypothetical protein